MWCREAKMQMVSRDEHANTAKTVQLYVTYATTGRYLNPQAVKGAGGQTWIERCHL